MIVAGGSYLEACMHPSWRRLFGSGLRAVCALAELSPNSTLYTYASRDFAADVEHTAHAFGCSAHVTTIGDAISFSYHHPLSPAERYPANIQQNPPLVIEGSAVLRFGFVEGDAIVSADKAVYDPQTSDPFPAFEANGSRARQLAIVLNNVEFAAANIDAENSPFPTAEVVIVKNGPRGATVYARGQDPAHIPPYYSESVFKIGSGDVFSAAFAHFWAERNLRASEAADLASRCVACFVDGHSLPLRDSDLANGRPIDMSRSNGSIYLAGPFFDLGQRWLIEEAYFSLTHMGAKVFSPIHHVGASRPAGELAQADLAGLRSCEKILALIDGADPGTLFEVGYARALNKPVVALAERLEGEALTMIKGSGCEVVSDFTTAIYRAIWLTDR